MKFRTFIKSISLILPVCFSSALGVSKNVKKVNADEETYKTVKMGYFEYGSMCRGASEGAEKSGYIYEFMQKISSYTGWKYEYDYGTFDEEYNKLKNYTDLEHRIDILPYTNKNEVRSNEVLFLENHPILQEEYFLAFRPGDTSIVSEDLSTLEGKTIATVKGADQNNILKKYLSDNGIHCTILEDEADPESTWNQLESGEVNLAVFSNISYREGAKWNVFGSFGKVPTYIAIAKDREDLVKELDKAFNTLIDTNPTFMSELEAEVYSQSPSLYYLTNKEREWLAGKDEIRIGCLETNNLVYADRNIDGSYKGYVAEFLTNAFKKLNISTKVEYDTYKDIDAMTHALTNGDIETAYPYYPSFTRAENRDLVLSNSLTEYKMSLIKRRGFDYNEALKKVAVLPSSLGRYYLESNFPETKIVVVDNIEKAVKLVKKGKVNGFVAENFITQKLTDSYGFLDERLLDKGCETTFANKIKDSRFTIILNRAISSAKKSEVSALVENNVIEPKVKMMAYLGTHTAPLLLVVLTPIFIAAIIFALIMVNRLRRKAQSANEAKTKFLFNMSHDIRTPMNAILGYTDMALRNQNDKEKVGDSLKKIMLASDHLLRLINDILEMSRIESDKLTLSENPLDLRIAVKRMEILGQTLAQAKKINFKVHAENIENPYVFADELHFNEVIINLLSNAIKYTQENGKVEYIVSQIEPENEGIAKYRFTVKDTGIGISEEFQSHLFESFSREKSSTVSKQEGAGLGLSIVKRIVDMANGTISVQSKVNKGSTFIVDVPIKVMNDDEIKAYIAEQEKVINNSKESQIKGCKILVVDDNEMNREITFDMLTELGGEIETAEDGAIAVKLLKEKGPKYYDFILMDVQMPIMDGYEATREIRKMYPNARIPIFALSANAFEEDKKQSLEAGMDGHISKPISIDELLHCLVNNIVK